MRKNELKPVDLQTDLVNTMGMDLFEVTCKEDIHEELMQECTALISQNEAYQFEDPVEVCERIYTDLRLK